MVAIPNFWMAGDCERHKSWNDGRIRQVMSMNNYTDYVGLAISVRSSKFSPLTAGAATSAYAGAVEYVTGGGGTAGGGSYLRLRGISLGLTRGLGAGACRGYLSASHGGTARRG